jgi:hypothetical protein
MEYNLISEVEKYDQALYWPSNCTPHALQPVFVQETAKWNNPLA